MLLLIFLWIVAVYVIVFIMEKQRELSERRYEASIADRTNCWDGFTQTDLKKSVTTVKWNKQSGVKFYTVDNSTMRVTRNLIDDDDAGILDDVNTSESESSPKIRRKRKKRSTQHRRFFNKTLDVAEETKETNPTSNENKADHLPPSEDSAYKGVISERLMIELKRCRAITPPLRQHIKLNLPESDLISYLNHYLLSMNDLKAQGYPYRYGSKAGFFKQQFSARGSFSVAPTSTFDVNAREFVPSYKRKNVERKSSCDSGQASGGTSSSSAPSTDSESGDNINEWKHRDTEKSCVRCKREFHVNDSGEYIRSERCTYHWGKFEYGLMGGKYVCCMLEKQSKGCSTADGHVWSGSEIGFNGPLDDFVDTEESCETKSSVFALDCEMCYTGLGLECTKVTLVGSDGHKVYEKYVRPKNKIICYNTRFSGVTKKHLALKNGMVANLSEVQKDLLSYLNAETILIGHALENDLRVLKIIHNKIIDTSVCFPHQNGPGFKHSLRVLTQQYLKRSIQDSNEGHSSFEDSRAALELMLWRVRRDFRTVLEQ